MNFSHIKFCADKDKVDLWQLQKLYQETTFWARSRSLEEIKIAIDNSNPVVSAWDNDNMIGCARATSDGIYRAAIWDVVIHPDYQGFGLGRKLVETVITHPLLNRVERIYLTTTNQQKFYTKIGFKENSTTTMVLYNNYPMTNNLVSESQQEEIGLIP
jgi:N-acetylglutamate synthase-like GNAT family acetyltransferase